MNFWKLLCWKPPNCKLDRHCLQDQLRSFSTKKWKTRVRIPWVYRRSEAKKKKKTKTYRGRPYKNVSYTRCNVYEEECINSWSLWFCYYIIIFRYFWGDTYLFTDIDNVLLYDTVVSRRRPRCWSWRAINVTSHGLY